MNYKLVKEAIKPSTIELCEVEKQGWFLLGGSLFVRNGATSMRDRNAICCNDITGDNRIQLPGSTLVTQVEITVLVSEVEE